MGGRARGDSWHAAEARPRGDSTEECSHLSFDAFPLARRVLDGIAAAGFEKPLPVQEAVIPAALEGRDLVVRAPTGTGKTAAYLIPIIESLLDSGRPARFRPKVLVLSPTRELARQVAEHFALLASRTKLRAAVLHGGTSVDAEDTELSGAPHLVVATPGRLLDHLRRGGLRFSALTHLVLDEADRLLDQGFLPEIERIVDQLPERRQTMLLSATMPAEMDRLARTILIRPQRIDIGRHAPRETVQEWFCPVPEEQKTALLEALLAREEGVEKVLVFVRTRGKARAVAPALARVTGLLGAELHSEIPQSERTLTWRKFCAGELQLLVATDLAARGLDIPMVTHVVNYDVPNTPDDYIHRVGRTGRVDRPGVAFTLVAPHELALASALEEAARRRIPTRRLEGFPYDFPEEEDSVLLRPRKEWSRARKLGDRPAAPAKKNPFTRSGRLRKDLREDAGETARPRRKSRKRAERKIKNRKLPHERRKR